MDRMVEKEKARAELSELWDEMRKWGKLHSDNLRAACELSEKYNNRASKYWPVGDRNEFEFCCSMAHAASAKYLDLLEAYRAKEKAFEQMYGHGWNCVAKAPGKEKEIEKGENDVADSVIGDCFEEIDFLGRSLFGDAWDEAEKD